jgi:hypothetical protein
MHSWLPWAPIGMPRHYICTSPDYHLGRCMHSADDTRSKNLIKVHKNRVLFASYGYNDSVSLDITSFFVSALVEDDLELRKSDIDYLIIQTIDFWWTAIKNPCATIFMAWKYVTTKKPLEIKIITSDLHVYKYVESESILKKWQT